MVHYYACSYPLAPGSVIQKGNWGRLCRMDAIIIEKKGEKLVSSFCPNIVTEVVFENVRLREFDDRPSRFDCNFVCPNIQSARNFSAATERYRDLLYEVELVDQDAKKLETDWSLITAYSNIAATERAARKYWNPLNIKEDLKEVLVEGDIRIVKRIL